MLELEPGLASARISSQSSIWVRSQNFSSPGLIQPVDGKSVFPCPLYNPWPLSSITEAAARPAVRRSDRQPDGPTIGIQEILSTALTLRMPN